MRKQRQLLTKRRPGVTVVETAFVLTALLLLVFAIMEYGRFLMVKHLVDNAAREGARLAVSANVSDTNSFNYQTATTIQNKVMASLVGQDKALTGLTVQVYQSDATGNNLGSWTNASTGQYIGVQVDGTYTPLFPGLRLPIYHTSIGFFPSSVGVHSKAVMVSEGN